MKKCTNEEIQKYLEAVTDEIAFNEARESTKAEILSHIEDHVETGLSYGLSRDSAIQDSLRRMGNPREIGRSLNQIHRPQFDFVLPLLALALSAVGLWNLSGGSFLGLQLAWIVVGLGVMSAIYFLPLGKFKYLLSSLYGLAIVGLAASYFSDVFVEGQPYLLIAGLKIKIVDMAGSLFSLGYVALGLQVRDSRRASWILVSLFLAPMAYFSINGFVWPGLLFFVSGLCFLGAQKISTAGFVGTGIVSAGMLIPRVSESLVSAEAVGKTIVENAHTDYALRSLSVAYGMEIFAGSMLVSILLYGTRLTSKIKDRELRSLTIVSMCLLSVQVFTSILANVGLLPMISAGVNIPFVSYGGSGIVTNFLILAVIISCYKRKNIVFLK